MALPEQCEVSDGELVFWELAHPSVLENEEGLYEHTCFVACTNGLRPGGRPEVRTFPFPTIPEGSYATWGGRSLTADEVERFQAEGYVLCQLRLPVTPMAGGPPPEERERPTDHPPIAERGTG